MLVTRSLDMLHRDQQAILNTYRADQTRAVSVTADAGSPPVTGEWIYARVAALIPADPSLGPHLLLVRQSWQGTPPLPADAGIAALRGYPLPGRSVNDFAVDQIVRVCLVPGAVLIEPLP